MSSFLPNVVNSYLYNEMYNQNGDGNTEFLTRGGLPAVELLNKDVGGSGGLNSLENKVVPIGLSVILRQPKRNSEHDKSIDGEAPVINDDLFDRLFDSVSPASKRRRTTPSNRKRNGVKGTRRIAKKHPK